jgi:hypothetical protein
MTGHGGATVATSAAPLTRSVLDFRPSRHGFHFDNRFPPGPTLRLGPLDPRLIGVGDAAAGLCGGMVLTVRDLFEARVDPPPDREPPPNGSRRFRALVRRQVQSLDWLRVPARFYDAGAFRPDPPAWWSRLLARRPPREASLDRAWPAIREEIDAGRLAVVGLVRRPAANPFRLSLNHQVLAFGYRVEPGLVAIRVYDPNWPDRDDVEARIRLGPGGRPTGLESSTGEPLAGLIALPYPPAEPRAWR